MAFVSTSVTAFSTASLQSAKRCAVSGMRVSVARAARAAPPAREQRTVVRMAQNYPESTVLGLGKDIPSALFLFMSAIALPLGMYAVYKSNLFTPLSAQSVNPQFVVGSLLVPISWGLHVAGFIQMKNGK